MRRRVGSASVWKYAATWVMASGGRFFMADFGEGQAIRSVEHHICSGLPSYNTPVDYLVVWLNNHINIISEVSHEILANCSLGRRPVHSSLVGPGHSGQPHLRQPVVVGFHRLCGSQHHAKRADQMVPDGNHAAQARRTAWLLIQRLRRDLVARIPRAAPCPYAGRRALAARVRIGACGWRSASSAGAGDARCPCAAARQVCAHGAVLPVGCAIGHGLAMAAANGLYQGDQWRLGGRRGTADRTRYPPSLISWKFQR